MSVNHVICNPAKQEYFEMWTFGEDDRYPATFFFHPARLLHTFALTRLCAAGPNDYDGRWYGHTFEIVSDGNEDKFCLVYETYTNISLPLLDSLCDGDEAFFHEILQRGLQDYRWDLPVTTALLTLIDDARYQHFRYRGWCWREAHEGTDQLPPGEDPWTKAVHSLREHYDQHYRMLKMEPPTGQWEKTFSNPAANPDYTPFES